MFEKFQTTLRKLLSVENLHIEGLHWRVENNVVTFEDIEMGGKLKVSLDQVLDIQYGGAWWIDEGGKKHGIGIQITRDVVESDLESVV